MTDPINENDNNDNDAPESVDTSKANGAPGGTATPDQLKGALEAAEATLTRVPEIDYLLVADRAEVVNGKLYLMGGSWDRIQPQQFPHRMMLGIAMGVRIPFAYTDDQHTVAIELLHDDTRMIGFEAKLATGRPPGMAGMDMLVPMAFNIPIAIPGEGQVVLRAAIDGHPGRRHEIKVTQRPQQQQQGQGPVRPA
ncbi:MAG: hypothetical protein U9O18_00085 [Chloroflexota bacterium]|nr:hypothetical protein [Chloroflexota bacterium]